MPRTYGTGSVYPRPGRGTFSISWPTEKGRKSKHGFPTEKAAKQQLAIELGDEKAGRARTKAAGPETLDTLAAQWLEDRKATHRSAYGDANRWKNHLHTTLGRLRPVDVTVAE